MNKEKLIKEIESLSNVDLVNYFEQCSILLEKDRRHFRGSDYFTFMCARSELLRRMEL